MLYKLYINQTHWYKSIIRALLYEALESQLVENTHYRSTATFSWHACKKYCISCPSLSRWRL